MPISVSSKILNNPGKYRCLVQNLSHHEDAVNVLSSIILKEIYREMFSKNATSTELRHLKNFIYGHKEEIIESIK